MPPCPRPLMRPAVRSVALTFGLTLAGALPLAAPAMADVSISPSTAIQGDATSVTFHVQNQRSGAHTVKLEVDLPADAPIAEVYPMTVPDWAPKIITRPAKDLLPGIHGSGLTDATSAVIWTRASDAPRPPAVETLRLEMGPLPEVPQLVFSVVQTYSDGTVQHWKGAPAGSAGTVLILTPDPNPGAGADGGAAGHAHQGQAGAAGATGSPGTDPDAATAQQLDALPAATATTRPADQGTSVLDVAAGGGLAVGVVVLVLLAARGTVRKPTDLPSDPTDVPTEPPVHVPADRS